MSNNLEAASNTWTLAAKGSYILCCINKTHPHLTGETSRILHLPFIKQRLEYELQSMSPYFKSQASILEGVLQRRNRIMKVLSHLLRIPNLLFPLSQLLGRWSNTSLLSTKVVRFSYIFP